METMEYNLSELVERFRGSSSAPSEMAVITTVFDKLVRTSVFSVKLNHQLDMKEFFHLSRTLIAKAKESGYYNGIKNEARSLKKEAERIGFPKLGKAFGNLSDYDPRSKRRDSSFAVVLGKVAEAHKEIIDAMTFLEKPLDSVEQRLAPRLQQYQAQGLPEIQPGEVVEPEQVAENVERQQLLVNAQGLPEIQLGEVVEQEQDAENVERQQQLLVNAQGLPKIQPGEVEQIAENVEGQQLLVNAQGMPKIQPGEVVEPEQVAENVVEEQQPLLVNAQDAESLPAVKKDEDTAIVRLLIAFQDELKSQLSLEHRALEGRLSQHELTVNESMKSMSQSFQNLGTRVETAIEANGKELRVVEDNMKEKLGHVEETVQSMGTTVQNLGQDFKKAIEVKDKESVGLKEDVKNQLGRVKKAFEEAVNTMKTTAVSLEEAITSAIKAKETENVEQLSAKDDQHVEQLYRLERSFEEAKKSFGNVTVDLGLETKSIFEKMANELVSKIPAGKGESSSSSDPTALAIRKEIADFSAAVQAAGTRLTGTIANLPCLCVIDRGCPIGLRAHQFMEATQTNLLVEELGRRVSELIRGQQESTTNFQGLAERVSHLSAWFN